MRFLILFVAALFAAASPAAAEWRRAVSPHFVIYSEADPGELRRFAEKLERFDGLLRMMAQTPLEEPRMRLTVYMPAQANTIAELIGVPGAAGFYRPSVAGSFAVAPRRTGNWTGMLDPDTVLFHEYAHHFMLQNYSVTYPAWLIEGYAELYSTTRFEADGAIRLGDLGDHRTHELGLDPLPLRTLLTRHFFELRGNDAATYYAQALLLTHFLTFHEAREGQLRRYVTLLGQGVAPEQAIAQAFGSLEALDRDFSRYRGARSLPAIRISFESAPPVPPIAIEALPPGEESVVWLGLRYRYGIGQGAAGRFAADVRRRAEAAPTDPAVLQLLADAEYQAGDLDAATRAVDALLALRPDAPRALLTRGLIELRRLEEPKVEDRARWTAARRWIARANRADPNDALALFEYHASFLREGVAVPENAALALMGAFQIAPQDHFVRVRLADQLVAQRRYSEAAIVLAPVAYAAHESSLREPARSLIERIRPLADGAELPAA